MATAVMADMVVSPAERAAKAESSVAQATRAAPVRAERAAPEDQRVPAELVGRLAPVPAAWREPRGLAAAKGTWVQLANPAERCHASRLSTPVAGRAGAAK